MKYVLIFLLLTSGVLTSGCDSMYRYECQDPDKWGEPQCQRPMCDATKTCPDDLLGHSITMGKIEAVEQQEEVEEEQLDAKCME